MTISYLYDALNRLTKIDFSSDTDIVYAYDTCANGKGRLCTMTDASGTTTYEYSAKGQVTKEAKVIDSIAYATQYSYDMNGNLKTMTYPSGRVITYNYTNDRAVSVLNNAANLATDIAYKPFGGMTSIIYGNGLTGSIGYDNQYRISNITTGSVMNLSYSSYDANGNITGITNILNPTKNKAFTYDALDRLDTATSSGIWGSLGWTYDGVGNRQTENANTYIYAPNTNKLTGANGKTFGYDNNGNTTTESARVYTYNQNQRLIQVVDGAMTAGYTYNGNGQRVKKNVNGVATVFHYSLSGQIIAESNGPGSITAEYIYLNGQPLAKIEGSAVYYYHNDHLATPQEMTDGTGQVVWEGEFKPFGEAISVTGTITNNLRFPGQYFDAETGLHYNYFRDYNPVIGRYVQADPIGIKQGTNHVYVYGNSNTLKFIDVDGLLSIWISAGGCAGAYVMAAGGNCCIYTVVNIPSFEVCSLRTCCMRIGVGGFVGASLMVGGSIGGGKCDCGKNLNGPSIGGGGDVGKPESFGGSVGISRCSISGIGGSGRMGVGLGVSFGVEICETKVLGCLNTPKKCECPN